MVVFEDILANSEQVIRDMAGTVLSNIDTLTNHPSFIGKTEIRAAAWRMEGAVGLYMVLVGQATHSTAYGLAEFTNQETVDRVKAARAAIDGL